MRSNTKKRSSKKLKKQETLILKDEADFDFFNCSIKIAIVRPDLEKLAFELGLIINPYMEHKIKWSEEHDGRCMCDWNNRKCPCKEIQHDLIMFGGSCLCKVLVTKEKMNKIEKYELSKRVKKDKTNNKEESAIKIKEAKDLAKKLGCKNC